MNVPHLCDPATVDWSKLTTSERIMQLELEGYVLIPDLIKPDKIAQMKQELYKLPTTPTDYSENQRTFKEVQFTDSPACIDLIAHPFITEFVTTLFGDEIICTSCVLALSRPGHPGIAIHTDSQPYGSKIFGVQASAPRLVRVLYYLDDLTRERAPLKVIPRSHLSLHADGNPYKRYLSHPEEVMITCKAGSAAIINQTIFHANYPNNSKEDRMLLAIAYRPAWAGPIAEVPDWPEEKLAKLPGHVRKYFKSLNTRNFDFNVGNRPPDMKTDAPGIAPSRWGR